ncbi:luciferin 4-monooxygenase-like [Choristoneura fumiferana]|uniref:luciferin 4-monooxygenase-like n=1 Tax=Choristoneura fumiferana TaxID=7141 RepID=UPI003D155ABA
MTLLERCDDNHVGHFFFRYMQNRPDDIFHIDAATGEQETRRSVLARTTRLAQCFRNMGLQPGDVLLLGGKNHLDMFIPFYAALMSGLPIAGVDPQFKYNEIKVLFKIVEPKIAFCESEMYEVYHKAVQDLGLNTKIVTFGGGECNLKTFMETYDDQQPVKDFRVSTFDTDKVYCWLVSTSGTTGFPKVVALRHANIIMHYSGIFKHDETNVSERRTALNLSSIQWISACYNVLTMPIHHTMVLTSAPPTTEHVIDIINKYKPAIALTTPTTLARILNHEKHCDLTCFDSIKLGGSKIHMEFFRALKARMNKSAQLLQAYGQTENGGPVLDPVPEGPSGNLGKPTPTYQIKIVDPESGTVIQEPNVTGELWAKGPTMACYYNNPKATAEAFSEDGYYKTGDLVYRDENDYYFFVDRLKMLLKYRNYQVIPPEVEEVILMHDGVADVCVTGVPHPDDGELVVACVVRKPGSTVTAKEIKDLVASELSVHKHLHGGVVFMDALPLTSTGKVARHKLREIVLTATREGL